MSASQNWKITAYAPRRVIEGALLAHEDAFDWDYDIVISGSEIAEDKPDDWQLEAWLPRKPSKADQGAIAGLFAGGIPNFTIERLPDPLIEEHGHHVTSRYCEEFWLPTIGPSALWLLRHVSRHTETGPYVVDVEVLGEPVIVAHPGAEFIDELASDHVDEEVVRLVHVGHGEADVLCSAKSGDAAHAVPTFISATQCDSCIQY